MSDKLKYWELDDFQEFPKRIVKLLLPNDMEFSIQYDPKEQGLIINKTYGTDDDNSITMKPRVSNEILIK